MSNKSHRMRFEVDIFGLNSASSFALTADGYAYRHLLVVFARDEVEKYGEGVVVQ